MTLQKKDTLSRMRRIGNKPGWKTRKEYSDKLQDLREKDND